MRVIILVLAFAVSVIACSDDAYRCVNPNGSVDDDWQATQKAMKSSGLSHGNTCWCYRYAEDYVQLNGEDQIGKFQKACESQPNYSWREC
jgi:hypothetical protein